VLDNSISLHGLWKNIGEGLLEIYDPIDDCFVPL